MSNFYVYQHRDPETGEIVYVGVGCKGRAWHSGKNTRSEEHARWMNDIFEDGGNPVVFISTGLTKKQSLDIEMPMIEELNPKFNKLGTIDYRHKRSTITRDQAVECSSLRGEGLSYREISEVVFPNSSGYMRAWRAINKYDIGRLGQ
jgi:hypothetical protein